jgi:hypothetical protein
MNSEFRIQNSESNGSGRFTQDGYQIIKSFLSVEECDSLAAELTPLLEQQQALSNSKIGGVRNLLQTQARVSKLSRSRQLLSVLEPLGGSPMFPVRAIFFDKNPESNWLVPWHQDLAIAVTERIETPGFAGWSVKDGAIHVHPPREILEQMITVRLHLDDCDASNGALKIIPQSHQHGKLGATAISTLTAGGQLVICEAAKGDVLLMRPLLLHASSPAENPRHRRILHIEYASLELPNGLKWLDR